MLHYRAAGKHRAGIPHEELKHHEFFAGEIDGSVVKEGGVLKGIQAELADLHSLTFYFVWPAQEGMDTCQQLFEGKGLGEIVICSRAQ